MQQPAVLSLAWLSHYHNLWLRPARSHKETDANAQMVGWAAIKQVSTLWLWTFSAKIWASMAVQFRLMCKLSSVQHIWCERSVSQWFLLAHWFKKKNKTNSFTVHPSPRQSVTIMSDRNLHVRTSYQTGQFFSCGHVRYCSKKKNHLFPTFSDCRKTEAKSIKSHRWIYELCIVPNNIYIYIFLSQIEMSCSSLFLCLVLNSTFQTSTEWSCNTGRIFYRMSTPPAMMPSVSSWGPPSDRSAPRHTLTNVSSEASNERRTALAPSFLPVGADALCLCVAGCVAVRSDYHCGVWRFGEEVEPRLLQVVDTGEQFTCVSSRWVTALRQRRIILQGWRTIYCQSWGDVANTKRTMVI